MKLTDPAPLRQQFASEAAFQAWVRELAEANGWDVSCWHSSRFSPAGFPDLVLIKPPYLLFRELKNTGGALTADQQYKLELLHRCGMDVGVWWPEDMTDIVETLGGQ